MSQTIRSGRFFITMTCGVAAVVFDKDCFIVNCGNERDVQTLAGRVMTALKNTNAAEDLISPAEVLQIAAALADMDI